MKSFTFPFHFEICSFVCFWAFLLKWKWMQLSVNCSRKILLSFVFRFISLSCYFSKYFHKIFDSANLMEIFTWRVVIRAMNHTFENSSHHSYNTQPKLHQTVSRSSTAECFLSELKWRQKKECRTEIDLRRRRWWLSLKRHARRKFLPTNYVPQSKRFYRIFCCYFIDLSYIAALPWYDGTSDVITFWTFNKTFSNQDLSHSTECSCCDMAMHMYLMSQFSYWTLSLLWKFFFYF